MTSARKCSICRQTGHNKSNKSFHVSEKKELLTSEEKINVMVYGEEELKSRYKDFFSWYKSSWEFKQNFESVRLTGIPEDISENFIKFVIRNKVGVKDIEWSKNTKSKNAGDLVSSALGKVECKSFTSDGPTSFGPKTQWNEIYFLDARNIIENKFIVYRVCLKNSDPLFKNLKVNKIEVKDKQSEEKRRPRLNFDAMRDQIGQNHFKEVFNGSFEEIFNDDTEGTNE